MASTFQCFHAASISQSSGHTISSCSKYTLSSVLDSRYITRQLQLQLHGSSDGVLWCGRTTQEPVLSREKCPHCFNPAFRLHFHHQHRRRRRKFHRNPICVLSSVAAGYYHRRYLRLIPTSPTPFPLLLLHSGCPANVKAPPCQSSFRLGGPREK